MRTRRRGLRSWQAVPSSIVLLRTDYLRYAEDRGALMGIVQAMLLTRHMLFVGFSLDDPNFHRVADSVRRAAAPSAGARTAGKLGTVLTLKHTNLGGTLWPEVRWVDTAADMIDVPDLSGDARYDEDKARAGRQLDILLDAVGADAVGPVSILESRFASLHGDDEAAAVEPLRVLARCHRGRAGDSPLWDAVGRLLREVGAE